MNIAKYKCVFLEFIRYVLVGGIAFLVDATTLYIFKEYVLKELTYSLYIATVIGFLAGTAVNYILSLHFVFVSAKSSNLGKSAKDILVFIIIGIIGLLINELGMYLGTVVFGIHYMIVKVLNAAIVMLWNYIARKILIFNNKSQKETNGTENVGIK